MTARPGVALCVVSLDYVAGLDRIDALMDKHVAWLKHGYGEGVFLASGRKVPRTGGIILVRGRKTEVAALLESDPFVSSGAATAEIIEFTASMASDGLAALLA